MALKLITPPAVEPVTLNEAKAHMRVDGTDEDSLIEQLIKVARRWCEKYQRRAYITQTWELWLDGWPQDAAGNSSDYIYIPRPPLQSVSSVKYYDTDDVEYTLDGADYFVDDKSEPGRIVLAYGKSWPSTTLRPANGICVTFVTGYGNTGDDVPGEVKQAILLLVAHWFEHREAVQIGSGRSISREVEFAVRALLGPSRVVIAR